MKSTITDINDIETWPIDVLKYLDDSYDVFDKWCRRPLKDEDALKFEEVISGLKEVLSPYFLRGYHCTRLTENEIRIILSQGMLLPNTTTLKNRIEKLAEVGILKQETARQLITENYDRNNRENMIWFCFYPPYLTGEVGIGWLFRLWGGEALSMAHKNDPIISSILNNIGTPCIIEAKVPLRHLFFELKFAEEYMVAKSLKDEIPKKYEGRIKINLPVDNIIDVIKFPDKRFFQLTNCHTWMDPLH